MFSSPSADYILASCNLFPHFFSNRILNQLITVKTSDVCFYFQQFGKFSVYTENRKFIVNVPGSILRAWSESIEIFFQTVYWYKKAWKANATYMKTTSRNCHVKIQIYSFTPRIIYKSVIFMYKSTSPTTFMNWKSWVTNKIYIYSQTYVGSEIVCHFLASTLPNMLYLYQISETLSIRLIMFINIKCLLFCKPDDSVSDYSS